MLDLLSEHGGSLDTLEYRLFKNFPRCPATSPPLFLKWVERFLKNNATDQDVFGWFRSVQEETGRPPTVAQMEAYLSLSSDHPSRKDFPYTTIQDGAATIRLMGKNKKTVLWKVPADGSDDVGRNFLPAARLLWPVYANR